MQVAQLGDLDQALTAVAFNRGPEVARLACVSMISDRLMTGPYALTGEPGATIVFTVRFRAYLVPSSRGGLL